MVNEVHGKASATTVDDQIFDNISDAVKFIRSINKNQKLFVGGTELNEEKVREALKGRLATISISNEIDKHRKWLITAF